MKTLFIGGTGTISGDCTQEALRRGMQVYHLNRGTKPAPAGVVQITADVGDAAAAARAIDAAVGANARFDSVVDWIAYKPQQLAAHLDMVRERCDQFVFISSASAYHKPVPTLPITESTPVHNPYWQYSRDKIACEQYLMDQYRSGAANVTIVRPSHTYNDGSIPTSFGSRDFTVPARLLAGKPIVVHGDGTSLWTLTHAADFARAFVGLLGNPAAGGETFHITAEQALTWDQIHQTIAAALGVRAQIVHVSSDTIARLCPKWGPGLVGDKAHSVIFDNTKVRRVVAPYTMDIPFFLGVRRSLAYLEQHPHTKFIDAACEADIEAILAAVG